MHRFKLPKWLGGDDSGGVATQPSNRARLIGFWLGLLLFAGTLLVAPSDPDGRRVACMAAVALLMAAWWISDAIPLAATSLLPLVLLPVLGIQSARETAPVYVNSTIFLYIGGFLIALAMERWNLHRRIALTLIRAVGGGPKRLVLSFMLASAGLSMWISNTATAIMMLAIGLAIVSQLEAEFGRDRARTLSISLLLGIAYACSIGGMATLIGTPPNLALTRIYEITFPEAPALSFGQWMIFGLPVCLLLLTVAWLLLTRVIFRVPSDLALPRETLDEEYRALGPVSPEERIVLTVFLITAFLWVFRTDLTLGSFTLPGWGRLLPTRDFIDDSTIAVGMSLLLFLLPVRSTKAREGGRSRILELDVFQRIPWHIVLLFGGGFALARGFQESGLTGAIVSQLEGVERVPLIMAIAGVCLLLTFLTEFTSNTATSQMILPLLASQAVAMELHPLYLMIPAVISASCAFMMPVATPPNAIVFSSGVIPIQSMVRAGILLNLVAVLIVTTLFALLGPAVFDLEPNTLPDWAKP